MSDLDNELREAVADAKAAMEPAPQGDDGPGRTGGEESPATAVDQQDDETRASTRRGIGLLVALLAIGGAILWTVFSSVEGAAIYSVTTDQLLDQKEKYAERTVRVQGELVKGSLRHRADPCEYRFWMEKNGKRIEVHYAQCVVPDTFRDVPYSDVQVTAEGKLASAGHFEATQIMAKCPSKYEMEDRKKAGVEAPHTLPSEVGKAP